MSLAATWMGLEVVIWVKEIRGREISYDIPYMQNLKRNNTNELIYKTETHSQTWEQSYGYQRWGVEGGIVREFGIDMYALLCFEWITNMNLLIAQGILLNIM